MNQRDSQKYKAELYDEVWQEATGMGYSNVTMALAELAALKAQEPASTEFKQFMTSVVTAAGLLSCGKQSKGLAAEISASAYKYLLAAPVVSAEQQGVADGWRPVPVSSLQRLLSMIDPAPLRMPNGDTMVFKNPNAGPVLREISAEIRAMLAAPAPVQQGLAVPNGGAVAGKSEPMTVRLGNFGKAFDGPGEKRAYTYNDQPGNVVAWRLGVASRGPAHQKGGDHIDFGLGLLLDLQEQGFGVFEIADKAPDQGPRHD